jgi:putative membrane protein
MQSEPFERPAGQSGGPRLESNPVGPVNPDAAGPMENRPKAPEASIFEGRLHPVTIVFGLMKAGSRLLPVAPVLLFGNKLHGFLLLLAIIAATLGASLARYFSFSYRIENNELITQHGILRRQQRSIPLERIQEIRVDQGVLHRLFGVVDAKVETGGGSGAEASLSVLSRAEADRLRRAVFSRGAKGQVAPSDAGSQELDREAWGSGGSGAQSAGYVGGRTAHETGAAPERVVIRRLGLKDLVLSGLTTNHLLSALALAGALWKYAEDLLPHRYVQQAGNVVYEESSRLIMQGKVIAVVVALAAALVVFSVGAVFSIFGAIIRFYGFTFSRSGEDLYRRYGLVTRRASSLPRRRIQVLKIEEKLFRRPFGLAALRADTSGSHRERKDHNSGHDVLLPIVRRNEVDDLLPNFFPDFDAGQIEWRRVSSLSIPRSLVKGATACAVLAAILLAINWRISSLWPFALAPLSYLIAVANYRNLAYRLSERYFCTRRGWAGRSTHIVPINKIQAVEIHQTPIDRGLGLATIRVDTAGQAYTGGGPLVHNLPIAEARELAGVLARRASVTRYRWGR